MSINLPVIDRIATVARPGVIVSTVTDKHGAETCAFTRDPDGSTRIARAHGAVTEANRLHAAMVQAVR